MIEFLRDTLEAWRGGGTYSVAVPPMDGALRPNQALEEAEEALAIESPDNLARFGERILFSSGHTVRVLEARAGACSASTFAEFEAPVSAMAADPTGGVVVGLESGKLVVHGGKHDGKTIDEVGDRRTLCPTALAFADSDTLLVTLGSQQNPPGKWKHDLMQRNASGSVWRVSLGGGASTCLADRLAFPYGVYPAADGAVLVSESWKNRILRIVPGAKPTVQLPDITGYPARLAPRADKQGAWLVVFAPRSQLIEFVLRERDYREQMMLEIDDEFWIAPSLAAPRSFLEPLQGGALKQLGILKPWAPTRSYGLVVQLGERFEPKLSFHSRADGRRHGITSCLEIGGRLLATSKGGDAIVSLAISDAKRT